MEPDRQGGEPGPTGEQVLPVDQPEASDATGGVDGGGGALGSDAVDGDGEAPQQEHGGDGRDQCPAFPGQGIADYAQEAVLSAILLGSELWTMDGGERDGQAWWGAAAAYSCCLLTNAGTAILRLALDDGGAERIVDPHQGRVEKTNLNPKP